MKEYHRTIVRSRLAAHTQSWFGKMLATALILVVLLVTLLRFGLLRWRAELLHVVSSNVAVFEIDRNPNLLKEQGFVGIAAFQKLCPPAPKLRSVRLYHRLLLMLAVLGPAEWAKREMDLCARYTAVLLMRQVARNRALAAEVSSF